MDSVTKKDIDRVLDDPTPLIKNGKIRLTLAEQEEVKERTRRLREVTALDARLRQLDELMDQVQ